MSAYWSISARLTGSVIRSIIGSPGEGKHNGDVEITITSQWGHGHAPE